MMDLHESLLVKTVRRALVAAVAVGSMAVLLDAGATYPGLTWRAASLAREPSELEREVSAPSFTRVPVLRTWCFRRQIATKHSTIVVAAARL